MRAQDAVATPRNHGAFDDIQQLFTVRQVQRKYLLGSRWTALTPVDGHERARHFQVVACTDELVTLRAIVVIDELEVPLTSLDDPRRWSVGWHSLP